MALGTVERDPGVDDGFGGLCHCEEFLSSRTIYLHMHAIGLLMHLHLSQILEPVMANLTLISHDLCPYVQRAAIALAEKGVGFRRVDIDLSNKPEWFRAISPL